MNTKAAPLTPAGPGGVAVVQISGPDAPAIISRIFHPVKKTPDDLANPSTGNQITFRINKLYFGAIIDGDDVIDQVILSVDPQNNTAKINCHGGPRIIQRLLMLLQNHNVEITAWDKLITPLTIADEVALFLPYAKTELTALTLAAQYPGGLHQWLLGTVKSLGDNAVNIDTLRQQITALLETFSLSQKLFQPPTVVLAGPANVGKSTLANALTGLNQSIATDLPGTTRDWTTQLANINGVAVNLIDTAGLRPSDDRLEIKSQLRTAEQLEKADLVILMVGADDNPARQIDGQLKNIPANKQTLVVINKSDLNNVQIPDALNISALNNENLNALRQSIKIQLGFGDFQPTAPIVFTDRQSNILKKTLRTPSPLPLLKTLGFGRSSF